MPRFGSEEMGGMGCLITNKIRGSHFTCPSRGQAESITAALFGLLAGNATVKCAIYRKSDNKLIGVTNELLINFGSPPEVYWVTFDFPEPKPILEAGVDYWLVAWSKAGTTEANIRFADETVRGGEQVLTYNSFPEAWSLERISRRYSLYCTYTETPPAPPITWWQIAMLILAVLGASYAGYRLVRKGG